MAEPLEYFNPYALDSSRPTKSAEELPPVAVPAEFDALLTRTHDLAAGRAIEAALRRARIDAFTAERGEGVAVELYVRKLDQPRAGEVAARIFARRRKLKSIPPPPDLLLPPRSVE